MSHSLNCPNCGDCLGPNAREIERDAYCSNCGHTFKNPEGFRIEEIDLECYCGEIHSNTVLERTGGRCPKEMK